MPQPQVDPSSPPPLPRSVYLFGSAFSWPQCAGAALTFGGGLLYSLPAHAPAREKEKVG